MRYIGHDEPWRQWGAALAGERMHHAWLLAGRKGVGKGPFAVAAAAELVGAEPGRDHPDIIVLTHLPKDDKEAAKRDEGKPYEVARNIKIDQIRAMQQRLTTRPTAGERRAVIIDPADDLEPNAANALLKSLEEPPVGTFFLLVAHRLGRLLPTIRSRCRVLRFPPVEPGEIDAILRREAPQADAATRAAAIAAAGGSPGAAIDFVDLGLGELHGLMQALVREGDGDFSRRGGRDHAGRGSGGLAGHRRYAHRTQHPRGTGAHVQLRSRPADHGNRRLARQAWCPKGPDRPLTTVWTERNWVQGKE